MPKRETLRIRLSKTKTIPEIEDMIHKITSDPESKSGAKGLDLYNKKSMKKIDGMGWAIYYLTEGHVCTKD